MKLKIVPIFEHMHHEAGTASLVRYLYSRIELSAITASKLIFFPTRTACLELLPSYPGQDFVILTLQTLTNLAKQTLIHIPDQVRY